MTVEVATYVDDLNPDNPSRNDFLAEGDDQERLTKKVLKNTFINANQAFDMTLIAGSVVPVGTIAMYYASTAPDGWVICDGSTYDRSDSADPANPDQITAPDLRGLFVRAANPDGDPAVPPSSTGGLNAREVTTDTAGSHTHAGSTASAGSHSHSGSTGAHALSLSEMPSHNHGGGNHLHTLEAARFYALSSLAGGVNAGAVYPSNVNINTDSSGTIISTQGSGASHSHGIFLDGSHTHTVTVNSGGSHTHSVTVDTLPAFYALTFIMKI